MNASSVGANSVAYRFALFKKGAKSAAYMAWDKMDKFGSSVTSKILEKPAVLVVTDRAIKQQTFKI